MKSDLFRLDSDTLRVNRRQHTPGVRILELHDSIGMLRWLSQYSCLYGFIMNAIWDMAKHTLQSVRTEQFQEAYAIPVGAIQEAEQALALRLIQRLAEVCRENGAELILIDIPVAREHGFSPSVPPSLRNEFAAAADHYLASEELFAELSNEGRLFVPHGQRHISASAHERIGQAVAEVITAD